MKDIDAARALARSLVDTGNRMGVTTTALLTDMNQPLGRMIGNANEWQECIDLMQGKGPADLVELTLALAETLLSSITPKREPDDTRRELTEHLSSGRVFEKFADMVTAQGGDVSAPVQLDPSCDICAETEGIVSSIDSEQLGYAVIAMGGGRRQQGAAIDHAVGLEMLVRIGDHVDRGQPLVRLFATSDKVADALPMIRNAVVLSDTPSAPVSLIRERI